MTRGTSPAGFTLLELMMVIFVVGIIAALAMPNLVLEDDSQALKKSADKLLTLLELQGEEAILTGTQRGLRLFQRQDDGDTSYHYQWMAWASDQGQWLAAEGQMRQLEGEIRGVGDLVLAVEGQPVEIEQELKARGDRPGSVGETNKKDDKGKKKQLIKPQAVVFSSGEVTNFDLTMTSSDGELTLVLSGDYDGVSLRDGEEAGD